MKRTLQRLAVYLFSFFMGGVLGLIALLYVFGKTGLYWDGGGTDDPQRVSSVRDVYAFLEWVCVIGGVISVIVVWLWLRESDADEE